MSWLLINSLAEEKDWLKVKVLLFCIVFLFRAVGLPAVDGGEAQRWFNLGVESFRWKKNSEASAYFRKAVELRPGRDEYYFYLGVTEHELGRFESAESVYSRGMELGGTFAERLRLNRANLRMQMGRLEQAYEDYSVLLDGGLRSQALLGRANVNLQESSFEEAVKDYQGYLRLDPASSQRSTIEKIIALLEAQIVEQEEEERLERERAFEEERRRLAEEARLAEEEARRQRLLDEVLQSLSGSGEDTTSIEAGNEGLSEDFEDSELEE